MQEAEDTAEGPRSFLHLLRELEYGKCATECSEKLFELGAAIRKLQIDRGGKVTGEIALKVKLTTDGDGPCQLHYDVSIKKPKAKRGASVFWITKNGNLTREDPQQIPLPGLREVPKPRAEERQTDNAADARDVP